MILANLNHFIYTQIALVLVFYHKWCFSFQMHRLKRSVRFLPACRHRSHRWVSPHRYVQIFSLPSMVAFVVYAVVHSCMRVHSKHPSPLTCTHAHAHCWLNRHGPSAHPLIPQRSWAVAVGNSVWSACLVVFLCVNRLLSSTVKCRLLAVPHNYVAFHI